MSSFTDQIDIFKHFSGPSDQSVVLSRINFAGLVGSTALMTYLYKMSISKQALEDKYGEDFAPRLANYFRYAAFGMGCAVIYHFWMYQKYPLQAQQELGIPSEFSLSKKQRYLIASCIAIPALIVEALGWKEAKLTPLSPAKFETEKELFGGIYDYIRHPIYLSEFSW
eukprot:CAMPEP_0197055902 /NCGR_PEP_ID=MMETSP1384-20130603/75200_1 /TAXON_ID=29189 /ORGANISM="Ammonia sp." /LENGTH=167 /DNA_ID=CAMNT_0042489655 /DNA_START=30 /DNA_END=530 /DNA_ORIENTATION=+